MSPSSSSVKGRHLRPIHSLVLDTAPLLTTPYGQIKSFNATNYYTVPLAKEEVKDENARAALQIWGNELRVRQPLTKSIDEGMTHVTRRLKGSDRVCQKDRGLCGFECC
jgi:hypothetical protein